MKKEYGLIFVLLLAVGLSIMLNVKDYSLSKEAVYGTAIDDAVRPLRVERQDLEQRKQKLEQELNSKAAGMGVNCMVFTELKEDIYTDAYPKLNSRSYPAVLAVSDESYPGAEDCLTAEQYQTMKKDGWTSCLYWDGRDELADYLAKTDPIFEELGEERSKVVYFQPGQYRRDFDEALLEAGFTIVINHGEEETPILQRSDEQELWRIHSLSWNRSGIKAYVRKAATLGGVFVMNLDFSEQRSGYISETFQNMCDYMNLFSNQTLMSPQEAREYRSTLVIDQSIAAEIEWCEQEIAEINREIRAIYENN